MRKLVLGFVSILIIAALAYVGYKVFSESVFKGKSPLFGVVKSNEAVLCDTQQHLCNSFSKTSNSGNLKVIISASGDPVKNLEVDLGVQPGAPKYYMRPTNNQGIALFEGIPSGNYFIYFNGINFPKLYGNSPTQGVEIIPNQVVERFLELTPNP